MPHQLKSFAIILILSVPLTAQEPPVETERVLLPIYTRGEVPGAFGSRWVTELAILNAGTDPVGVGYDPLCNIMCAVERVPPGRTFAPALPFDTSEPVQGFLLHMEKSGADRVHIQLRVRDVSQQAAKWGTELPVVRESEAFTRDFNLLDIPVTSGYRQMLRVYEFATNASPGAVHIKAYGIHPQYRPERTDELLFERVLSLRFATQGGGRRLHPGYADLSDFLTDVDARFERVRIEVSPLSAASRLWAFVSITNNQTQQVTVISPQP